MPTQGLSLVGFLDQAAAIQYLRNDCISEDGSDAALTAEWSAARTRFGAATPNAGNPEILDIPAAHAAHVQQITNAWAALPGGPAPWMVGASFKMVEIDPLLAYQIAVDTERANHHCGAFVNPPTIEQLLPCSLPLAPQQEPIHIAKGPQSMLLRARSLNVFLINAGQIAENAMGVTFGVTWPYVHVVRHNNRCYLHNGFHRAYGLRRAGATHVPCLFRDVHDHAAVGIRPGATFSAELLESENPPTLAHFTQGRAHPVRMKIRSRVLHVSWAEYVVLEE